MMNELPTLPNQAFSAEQKEYLQGFFAAAACRPFAGHLSDGRLTSDPASGVPNAAAETVFGTPVEDLCEQEHWKRERNGLDVWDTLVEHARADKLPDKKDDFYFRFHGLF
ncbi:MAG: NirA family protein, partial [Verrucomicrobiaceae bacterium]|nr:NirA family protein [Verrucomicrobiaceae bacterium]